MVKPPFAILQNVPVRSTYYIIYLQKLMAADPKEGGYGARAPPKYANGWEVRTPALPAQPTFIR
jgi:hypothetical protein